MTVPELTPAELVDAFGSGRGDVATALDGAAMVLVDASAGALPDQWSPGAAPVVVIAVTDRPAIAAPGYDVALTADDPMLDAVLEQVARHPIAGVALAVLLRQSDGQPVEHGLAAESAVYSTLQAGPEFGAWRRGRRAAAPPVDREEPVLSERIGDVLHVALNRPARHNAVTTALRDWLAEALTVAVVDETITAVELSGNGPSFCSGGDLAEFGSLPDPATAHVTRLTRSPARLAHLLSGRLHVHLHGACLGAGIELAAFAHHVIAAVDTVIALPELGLGLVPGAGGTVSIARRTGRQRAAALALSGASIDPATALAWGLVDEVR